MIEFNKKLMMDNIWALLKRKGMKVGELESRANVSTGYLSRLTKDENSKPSVELVVKIAGILGVSLDALLYYDLRNQYFEERYFDNFLVKLYMDTQGNSLDWKKETPEILSYCEIPNEDGTINHPLFDYELDEYRFNPKCSKKNCKVIPCSELYDESYVYGNWFSLEMEGKAWLYLISVHEKIYDPETDVESGLELWLCFPNGEKQCLCTTEDDLFISSRLRELYELLERSIRFDKNVKSIIDAFMREE